MINYIMSLFLTLNLLPASSFASETTGGQHDNTAVATVEAVSSASPLRCSVQYKASRLNPNLDLDFNSITLTGEVCTSNASAEVAARRILTRRGWRVLSIESFSRVR